MKKTTKFLLLTLLATVVAFGFSLSDDDESKEIKWLGFKEALEKGKTENKMIVVDFYTDWCSWCKVMDKKTYGNSEIIDFASKKLVLAKVNAESNEKTIFKGKEYTYRQLSAGFGITGYPATVFLSPDGEFITDVSGYVPAEKFMPILEFLEGKHYQSMKYEEYLAKRKTE